MKNYFLISLVLLLIIAGCAKKTTNQEPTKGNAMGYIDKQTADNVIKKLLDSLGNEHKFRIERGVAQVAALWQEIDGDKKVFEDFCLANFIADTAKLDQVFQRVSTNFETLFGHFNKISLDLKQQLHLDQGEILPIDQLFGGYEASSHLYDDFFANKIAFNIALNFPTYTLEEKTKLGENWTRKQWAYARLGDVFTSRVPAELILKVSEDLTASDSYISDYNIFMGNLLDNNNQSLFPENLVLITHWGLRDELKTHYGQADGLNKQKIIYEVMKRIINQDIPQTVINNKNVKWNPFQNKVLENGKEIANTAEPNTRYNYLLKNFQAMKAIDAYSPNYPSYIKRKFEQEMEIPQEKVEEMFIKFVSSPVIKQVGELISKRLGRNLEPFDIWYDGFKSRSSISQEELDKIVGKKYPNKDAYEKDLPNILKNLGFNAQDASLIASKITVDAARGSGHAWGADMKSEKAHLRTRIAKTGMTYKGYNIATHEFGHNVEQTITLNNVDYYMMRGVPNTAFTEAWAFIFQARDLELLNIKDNNKDKKYFASLDNLWSCYEIMGVSLLDMNVWKWLYKNPNATPEQLKKAVVDNAIEIWNKYYAPVFGVKDQPILAIYSHMIDNPLYLSAYPIGHLIEFQIEQYMKDKNIGSEMLRICSQGRYIPEFWMKNAVGNGLSIEPTLNAGKEALNYIK